jgi:hypothetical protein
MGKAGKILGAIFIFAVISYGVLYITTTIDFSFLKGEIIAYPMQCDVKTQYGLCPGKTSYAMRATHFKPDYNRQEVAYWVGGLPPDSLKNCTVVDRENWKCEYDDKSDTFGFQNGVYFDDPPASTPDDPFHEYYVSRQVWLQQECNDSIYAGWLCIPFYRILRTE